MPVITPHYRQTDGRGSQQFMVSAKEQQEETWNPDRDCRGYEEPGTTPSHSPPKRARAKDSSKHFGVRFRPDLQKWVAEIRVAEWRSVDKKVWLGTFDSEEGAARAVDAARKLLKCKKKRPPNFPCENLKAYSERIPPSLNLNNLGDEGMFKEVTVFVKRKAQEYAASFGPGRPSPASLSAQLFSHPFTSELAVPPRMATLLEHDMAFDGWTSPMSLPMSGPGSLSTSPGSDGWVSPMSLPMSGPRGLSTSPGSDGWSELSFGASYSEWGEEMYLEMDQPMDAEFIAEFLEVGDEQPQCDDSLIFHSDEIFSGMENHNVCIHQNYSTTYNSDYEMVC